MFNQKGARGVALLLVLATTLVIMILANIVLAIISSQGRLTQHQVSRVRAYYAAQAALVYTMEMLRNGTPAPWKPNPGGGKNKYACLNGCVDTGVNADYNIPADTDIPFRVQVAIYPKNDPNKPVQLDAKVDYTYTP